MTDSNPICYLCGEPILHDQKKSDDHVFPKQFVKRPQPKQKGFTYAGVLKTHWKCNQLFGEAGNNSEALCKKAMGYIWVLWDSEEFRLGQGIEVIGIDAVRYKSFFSDWKRRDYDFFGIDGSPNIEIPAMVNPNYWKGKPKIDPYAKAIELVLSVLIKSAAAFLVKHENIQPNVFWDITAISFFYETEKQIPRFENKLGHFNQLEYNVKLWVKSIKNGDKVIVFVYDKMAILLYFSFTEDSCEEKQAFISSPDQKQIFEFKSNKLTDLVGYEWSKHLIE